MAAPTFVSFNQPASNWASTLPSVVLTTPSFSVLAGDLLVVFAGGEDGKVNFANLPTGGSLTYTSRFNVGTANGSARATGFTAPVDVDKSMTVSLQRSDADTGLRWGFVVYVYRAHNGVGNVASVNGASGAPSLAITASANSALPFINVDWAAVDGTSRTWRTINSITPTAGNGDEKVYQRAAGNWTVYSAYWPDSGTAGSVTTGISAPGSQTYSAGAIEVKASSSGVTGTLNSTLGNATVSASGTVAIAGTLNSSLTALSPSAAGAVAVSGSETPTLGELTSTGGASVAVQGTSTSTLGAVTSSATGVHTPITGTLTSTLGDVTASAAGVVAVQGSATSALGAVTISATGAVAIAGTSTPVFAALTSSATGVVSIAGVISQSLGALTVSATGSGSAGNTGVLSSTLAALSESADGQVAIAGELAPSSNDVTLTSTGGVEVQGALSSTLGTLTVSASGTGGQVAVGDLSQTLAVLTLSATASVELQGTLGATLGQATVTSGGAVLVGGSLAATLGAVTLTASGQVGISGTLAATLGGATVSATGGAQVSIGTLSAALADASIASSGSVTGVGIIVGGGAAIGWKPNRYRKKKLEDVIADILPVAALVKDDTKPSKIATAAKRVVRNAVKDGEIDRLKDATDRLFKQRNDYDRTVVLAAIEVQRAIRTEMEDAAMFFLLAA